MRFTAQNAPPAAKLITYDLKAQDTAERNAAYARKPVSFVEKFSNRYPRMLVLYGTAYSSGMICAGAVTEDYPLARPMVANETA